MKRILLAIFVACAIPAAASHIVGGEFEIIHVSGNNYRISLILYFDVLNGSTGARDAAFSTAIFRKRDNAFMQNVYFQNPSESPVSYTQPSCSNGEIVTTKLVYTTDIVLSDSRYNDPAGYYIIWERCCRNYTITNIFSDDPSSGGQAAGQTFYLEFPPVVKDGEPFFNSTPHLFPPLSDYACPRKPYYVDFAGTDDDGDSLVYSLTTPLSTHTTDAFPPLRSAPYPLIQWRDPFSIDNIVAGAPDLKISNDGFLTATPTLQGLFVFAVKCEEYRDGQKIGEVRRDFQMLVVDVCPRAEAPQITGKSLEDADFGFDEEMSVTFSSDATDEERCIEVEVSDADASKEDDNFTENVQIRAIPIGFQSDVSDVLPEITTATLVNGSKMVFQVCFEKCPLFSGPYQIGIVAYDDACSLPLSDTLIITVNITPPPNERARFTTLDITETLDEGQLKTWPIRGIDADGDQLVVGVILDNFRMEDVGMKLVQTRLENGTYEAYLEWDTRCDVYDFSNRSEFLVKVLLDDVDECLLAEPDTMTFDLKVDLPGNATPIIDSDLTADPQERFVTEITRKVNESLVFHVTGNDNDNDFMVLGAKGVGFELSDYDIVFPGASGNGSIVSPFTWNILCDVVDLDDKDEFTFEFIVVDNSNKCRMYKADTLSITVELLPPDNERPTLLISNLEQDIVMTNNGITIELGQQITLGLSGTDTDLSPEPDYLKLELIEVEGPVVPEGYIFAAAEGRGTVNTTFAWKPECSLLASGLEENNFTFTFSVTDDRCFNKKGDTLSVDITVKDVSRNDEDFMPPNIITPNGDNLNDYFAMVKEDPESHELVSILPRDNCSAHFEGISIFNRWGKQVFESFDRDFKWFAENEAAGIYYYTLMYTDKDYKGSITIAYD